MKKSVRLASEGLTDLSYNAGQFAGTLSLGSAALSKNNANGMGNSLGKPTRENLRFDKSQKSSMGLVILYEKLIQESSCMDNVVDRDLIMVGN